MGLSLSGPARLLISSHTFHKAFRANDKLLIKQYVKVNNDTSFLLKKILLLSIYSIH